MKKIILDTNFLMAVGQFKVDIFSEIYRICNFNYQLFIIGKTVDELKKIIQSRQKGKDKADQLFNILTAKTETIKLCMQLFTAESIMNYAKTTSGDSKTTGGSQDGKIPMASNKIIYNTLNQSADRNLPIQNLQIGTENPVEVRLLAAEVSPEIASSRRRKAKKENKGHHPSQAVLFLLGYTIFLTSLTSETLSLGDFLGLYGLRWRIESIFKTWKSHFNFDKIHTVGENQLRLILMARFMVITLFYEKIYVPLAKMMAGKGDKGLSVMKLMRYLTQNFSVIPHLLKAAGGSREHLKIVEKYCTYDKRKRPDYAGEERRILMVMETVKNLT